MTICKECRKSFPKNIEPTENFKSIIDSLEEDKLRWHLHYNSKTIHLRFALVAEEEGKCCVSFLRGSPAYRVAKFTESLEDSGVDSQIDPVHSYDEDGSIVFPWDFDSAEEFRRKTASFEDIMKRRRRDSMENPMFR